MKYTIINLIIASAMLSACGMKPNVTTTAMPTVNLDERTNTSTGGNPSTLGSFTASGVLKPYQEAELGFLLSSYVEIVNVSIGDSVKKGQILAVIGGKEQAQAAVSSARLEVQTAQNDVDRVNREAAEVTAKAQTDLIEKKEELKDKQDRVTYLKHERWIKDRDTKSEKSKKNEGFPTPADIAKAEAELALAQAIYDDALQHMQDVKDGPEPSLLASVKSKLLAAQDNEKAAGAKLSELEIKAPFNGIVSAINISAGDLVTAGQVLFIITDTSQLYVETTDLSERNAPAVEAGQSVTVWIKALSTEVAGKVLTISPRADSIGGDVVYQVLVSLENVPEQARAGMSVEVRFR